MCEYIVNTYHYFETLYLLNQKLIKLSGTDAIRNIEESIYLTLEICDSIPRLIPYTYNKKKHRMTITSKNGLMEYRKDIPFLLDDYKQILDNHYDLLDRIRILRNKYEHKMHVIKFKSESSSSIELFEIELQCENDCFVIHSYELVKLVKELNILFSKIISQISAIAFKEKDSYASDLYEKKLERLNFKDINKLFDSEYLRIVGKLMYDF